MFAAGPSLFRSNTNAADIHDLLNVMLTQLKPMGNTVAPAVTYATGPAYYVRPDTTHSATRDGTSYATAWGTLSEIVWGSLGPNTTLWVCGEHNDAQLTPTVSGSQLAPMDIRLDYPSDPGSIFGSRIIDPGEWIDSGVNGEWYIEGPDSADMVFFENRQRLRGCSKSSKNSRNIVFVDPNTDEIEISPERPFLTGTLAFLDGRTNLPAIPAPLAINTAYYVIRVSDSVCKLATSYANAMAGIAIDITTAPPSENGIARLFVINPTTHFDPTIGSLPAGWYWVDGVADRLYYKPTTGVPSDHELRIQEDRSVSIGAAVYCNNVTDIRFWGGGKYGGIFGDVPLGNIGLASTNAFQVRDCYRISIDGVNISGDRSMIAFVGGSHHTCRNCKISDFGWHGIGGEGGIIPEHHLLLERNWLYGGSQLHDYGDAQGIVFNAFNDFSVTRRNLIQKVGRDNRYVNNGVLVFDICEDSHSYRNIIDQCYGECFEHSFGSKPGNMKRNSISSNLVWRHNEYPNPMFGTWQMARSPFIAYANNSTSALNIYEGMKAYGNLVINSNFPSSALWPTENFSIIMFRPNYPTSQITDVEITYNAFANITTNAFYSINHRTPTAPTPTWFSDHNIFAGVTGELYIQRRQAVIEASYSREEKHDWFAHTGHDRFSSCVPVVSTDVHAELPTEAYELLRLHDQYDTLDFPTIDLIGTFPYSPRR